MDGGLLVVLLGFALLLIARTGFRRSVEFMPWPDGLEYAAVAVNIDRGIGPVLHFGGYSYPPRYTDGYPLMLAAAYPVLGRKPERLYYATVATGLVAIAALYLLVLRIFDRPSAFIAALILAASPLFVTYSTLVMSDVPTLMVTILAALVLCYATESEQDEARRATALVLAAIFGLLAGLSIMIRPTNATMLAGLGIALAIVPPGGSLRRWRAPAIGAAGLAIFPAWQALENVRYLGAVLRSGYVFWVPEVYGRLSRTFGLTFLLGPTMPRNPHGNLVSYSFALMGLDGMLGDPGVARYILYPFGAAVFAAIGIAAALRSSKSRATRRVVWFGLGFLASLVAVYMVYFFTEIAFILPACFIVFAAAGYGAVTANRRMSELASARRRSGRDLAAMCAVFVLDLLLVVSLLAETAARLSARPEPSRMVPALSAIGNDLEPGSIVVSNVSLQFLELYLPRIGAHLVGLNSFDPGERFTDYHLARLYAKRARGWGGEVPAVVFDDGRANDAEISALANGARAEKSLYLLLAAPQSPGYAELLSSEMERLGASFNIELLRNEKVLLLYRLVPR